MHLNNQPPVFVPDEYWDEISKLSKAALMDMVWDYAMQNCGGENQGVSLTMDEIRKRREIILNYRKQRARQDKQAEAV